ncbi:uncharacterized protein MKZ38_007308 [Zalerion maritima]|uniref:F-box domain-containing protein n=1 Tax=Zalerion maritima TaxID=339359 RepID=A0AAD5RJ33_9PEZI|nr:uncharacterized protein MKZ38_007308 [Zalerion maritima]
MVIFPTEDDAPNPDHDEHHESKVRQQPYETGSAGSSLSSLERCGTVAGDGLIERLPFDVLVLIVRHLDRPSVALLCQSSKTFRAWFIHLAREEDRSPRSWTHLDRMRYRESLRKKKQLCSKCKAAGSPPKPLTLNQALHCSACSKDHPLALFSARQREVEAKKRVCRLQEATLPVCSHLNVKARDLDRWKHKRRCYHLSHLIPSYLPQLLSVEAWKQRWKERPGIRIIRPSLCTWHGCRHMFTPPIDVEVHRTHDLLILKKGELPTVPRIRAALKKLEAKGTFKLCPHIDLDDLSVTTCNPDQCPCLVTQKGGMYWPQGLHVQQEFGKPKYYPRWLFDDWWFPDVDGARDDYFKAVYTEPCLDPTSFLRSTRHVSFQKCCMSETSIYRDPSNPRVVRISYDVPVSEVHGGSDPLETWDRYVDPASLGVLSELESKHLFWCEDPSCKRYYRQPDLYQRFSDVLYKHVRPSQKCTCAIPFWAMSPSQYDLRYDPKRDEKDLDHDTYYDGISYSK